MRVQFSSWYPWEHRQDIPSIGEKGVYIIGRGVKRSEKPNLCSKRIVYVGYTEKSLLSRLKQFERACQGRGGHAGGNSFFRAHIYPDLGERINELRAERGLSRRDATRMARDEANFVGRMPEFAETWQRRRQRLSVAVWVPPTRWNRIYSSLPEREQLKFVETKIQVDYVRKNKRLPEHNRTFG